MEFLERGQQLAEIKNTWGRVARGKGSIVLVSGEAGIRKTSLIERFVSEQGKSARVLWGACDHLFTSRPLGPILDIALQLQSNLLGLIQSGADRLSFSSEFYIQLQSGPSPAIVILEDLHWTYYDPVNRAFATRKAAGQAALRHDLEQLWTEHYCDTNGTTRYEYEYLEVVAIRE